MRVVLVTDDAVEINFCMPGQKHFPGSVSFVGCQVSAVKEGGTVMEAFNAFGRSIGSVYVKGLKGKSFYLAMRSQEPIAKIRIAPVLPIDPDFAFDDLYFSEVRPIAEFGRTDINTLVLHQGSRIQANQVTIADGQFIVEGLTFDDEGKGQLKMSIKQKDVAIFIPRQVENEEATDDPEKNEQAENKELPLIVGLTDSSLVFAEIVNGQVIAKRTKLEIPQSQIVAIWNGFRGSFPADATIPKDGALLIEPDSVLELNNVTWGKDWIESESLQQRPDLKHRYTSTPTIFFQKPDAAENGNAGGLVRTIEGDIYQFGKLFQFNSLTSEGLTVTHANESFKIPMTEILSLRFPE